MVAEHVLKEVMRRLVKQFSPTRIILFGWQARGTADDRSDVADEQFEIVILLALRLVTSIVSALIHRDHLIVVRKRRHLMPPGVPEIVEKCLNAGCDAHLSKPIQSQDLFYHLERYFGDNS